MEVGKLSWLSSHEAGGVAPSENPESPGSSSEARWASSLEGRNQDPELDGPGAAKSAEKPELDNITNFAFQKVSADICLCKVPSSANS